jgi:DNA-directed RNA polymerase specialized sigma24 family protein
MVIDAALNTPDLALRCREESAKPPHQRPLAYCFELFRRAIVEADQLAWAALHAQYIRLVRSWLGNVADPESLVQETFARFSRAVRAERFDAFPNLTALLGYLRCTAISLRINEHRQRERERRALMAWGAARLTDPAPDDTRAVALQELIDHVYSLLQGEQERLVFDLTYQFALPPREIVRRYPSHFTDVAEVNRIKERLKKRLQRDPRLHSYLEL